MEKILTLGCVNFFIEFSDHTQYVFLVSSGNLDRWPRLRYWEEHHDKIAEAINRSTDFHYDVVFCGTYSKYNEKLGITETFSDMSDESRDQVKKLIIEVAPKAIEILRREDEIIKETWRVGKLLDEYRYGDAKEHCRIFDLNYSNIIYNRFKR
jgi:hypothetical protein